MHMKIELPVLSIHKNYILPVKAKDYGLCGLVNFERGCYDGVRFIDSLGQEWLIDSYMCLGYKNWLQYLYFKKEYKSVKVSFNLVAGKRFTFEELKNEIAAFLYANKLQGSPFINKANDIPKYLSGFESIADLVSKLWYFDARKTI
jgi:hypothetical protein